MTTRFESIDQIPATFSGLELIRKLKITTKYAGSAGGYGLIAECQDGEVKSFEYIGPTHKVEIERWLSVNCHISTKGEHHDPV